MPPVKQPEFPLLFSRDDPHADFIHDVFSTVLKEAQRAAFVGRDDEAVERVRFSIDLPVGMNEHLQALAIALGSSRRAMATKLLTGAILEAVNAIEREGSRTDPEMHWAVVRDEYQDALKQQQGKPA